MATPGNGTPYRILALERAVDRLERLEPAVLRQEVSDLKDDLRSISRDVAGMKRMFMGFIISFALANATLVAFIFTAVKH